MGQVCRDLARSRGYVGRADTNPRCRVRTRCGSRAARRRRWLIAQGLAEESGGAVTYRADLLAALQRRELLRVAGQLSSKLQLPFVEAASGSRVDGLYRRPVDLASGRFALVERSRDFTLVPWRPVLDARIGKPVSGILRDGGVSWSFGRGRRGPSIG